MLRTSIVRFAGSCLLAAACLAGGPAMAQSAEPSLAEVYAVVQAGKLEQAQAMVQQVLLAHPGSAKAFYVRSELFARQGDLKHAREALASAERLAPALPFAKPEAVQALRAQLSGGATRALVSGTSVRAAAGPASAPATSWGLPLLLTGGVLVVGYLVFRRRPPQSVAPQAAFAAAGSAGGGGLASPDALGVGGGAGVLQPGFAQAPAAGMGGRIMGGVATGLAVGAGVVAAEAIGRSLMGRHETAPSPSSFAADDDGGLAVNRNADMGGQNFGVTDAGSWDDGATGLDLGGGDWDN